MKKSSIILFFAFINIFSACKKTDPCDDEDFNTSFQDNITAITDAATFYGQDPTEANCNKFKNAYIDYVKALEDWDDCAVTTGQNVQWQQALDAARASIDDIEC